MIKAIFVIKLLLKPLQLIIDGSMLVTLLTMILEETIYYFLPLFLTNYSEIISQN